MIYKKHIEYQFEVDGEIWSVTSFIDTSISFNGIKKNGDNNTNLYGEAMLVDGKWSLDYHTKNVLEEYWGRHTIQKLEEFFNKHGPPSIEKA